MQSILPTVRFRVAWGCKIHDAAELVLVIDTERNICELVWLSLASINFYILSRLAAEMGRG